MEIPANKSAGIGGNTEAGACLGKCRFVSAARTSSKCSPSARFVVLIKTPTRELKIIFTKELSLSGFCAVQRIG